MWRALGKNFAERIFVALSAGFATKHFSRCGQDKSKPLNSRTRKMSFHPDDPSLISFSSASGIGEKKQNKLKMKNQVRIKIYQNLTRNQFHIAFRNFRMTTRNYARLLIRNPPKCQVSTSASLSSQSPSNRLRSNTHPWHLQRSLNSARRIVKSHPSCMLSSQSVGASRRVRQVWRSCWKTRMNSWS